MQAEVKAKEVRHAAHRSKSPHREPPLRRVYATGARQVCEQAEKKMAEHKAQKAEQKAAAATAEPVGGAGSACMAINRDISADATQAGTPAAALPAAATECVAPPTLSQDTSSRRALRPTIGLRCTPDPLP